MFTLLTAGLAFFFLFSAILMGYVIFAAITEIKED